MAANAGNAVKDECKVDESDSDDDNDEVRVQVWGPGAPIYTLCFECTTFESRLLVLCRLGTGIPCLEGCGAWLAYVGVGFAVSGMRFSASGSCWNCVCNFAQDFFLLWGSTQRVGAHAHAGGITDR